jgi:hypothetical protein
VKKTDLEGLEFTAREELVRSRTYDVPFRETVGIIFEFAGLQTIESKTVVFAVENVGPPGKFEVVGAEWNRCAEYLVGRYGHSIGDRLLSKTLWHSHSGSIEPSRTDIAEFPEWLADVGIVYHAPTGTSTAYGVSGIISGQRTALSPVTSRTIERGPNA